MASRAYLPEQTQAPYHGWWKRSNDDGVLQIDHLFLGYDEPRGDLAEAHDPEGPLKAQFRAHYSAWLQNSVFDSLPDAMRGHASYRAIVEMGDRVVPLIASELRKEPGYIFLALEDITEEDPVPDEALGDLDATVAAWLSWLRK